MILKKLLVYMKGFGRECVLGPLFKLLEASFELIVPLIVAAIIDRGIPALDRGYIVRMCLWLVALGGVGLLSAVTAQYFAAKAAIGFSARLRHALMEHIGRLGYTELDRIGTSTLVTRMTSDVNQVQTGVNMTLRLLLRSPFVVFGAMIMAFTIDVSCAAIFAGVIAVLCVIVFGIMLVTIPMYRRVQGQLDSVTAATRENLTGVRVVRAFGKEQAQEQFGFLLDAFKYGVPPHAGLAYGLDRLVMLMAKEDSIRDVMAFPKVKDASCLMTAAPNLVDTKQLDELGLALKEEDLV